MIAEDEADSGQRDPESRVRLSDRAIPVAAKWGAADGFDALPDAVIVTDLQGRVLFVNRAAIELLNVERGEILGRPLLFFVVKSDCRSVRRALKAARARTAVRFDVRMRPRHARPVIDAEVRARVEGETCAWVVRERLPPVRQ